MARAQPRGGRGREALAGRPNRADADRATGGRGRGRGRRGGNNVPAPVAPPSPVAPQAPVPAQPAYVTEQHVLAEGLRLGGFPGERQNVRFHLNRDRFRSLYGVSPKAIQVCSNDLSAKGFKIDLVDLLMAINWLRLYDTEHVLAGRWGRSEEHIRYRVRACCKAIQSLKDEKISWLDQPNVTFFASVDGTHCRIYEPRTDADSKWFSHKFNGPGVAYEIVIALYSNSILSVRGPFPASVHDITIFRGGRKDEEPKDPGAVIFKIKVGQRVIGDSGYEGEPTKVAVTREGDSEEVKKFKARAKSRHESFNSRLKAFRILDLPFRHGFGQHQLAFEAVTILCQYDLENGHGLMDM